MSKEKSLLRELEGLSGKKMDKRVGAHRRILEEFQKSSEQSIQKLQSTAKNRKRIEKRIIDALENDRTPEAMAALLDLRVLKIEEMVEESALSVLRSNRFYNQLVLDLTKGIDAGVKYDTDSMQQMVPDELKQIVSTSVASTDFYDILSKYKGKLNNFINNENEQEVEE